VHNWPVEIGIQFHPGARTAGANLWELTATFARAAEESGLGSFWLYDHVMLPSKSESPDDQNMLDCFVALGGLAASTSRVLIGQLVAAVPFRNPALTAKMASTLDVMSHGRAVLGLGAGWNQREFDAYGWPFEDVPTRLGRLEEAVQIVLRLWDTPPASFQGRFYQLDRAVNEPRGVRSPRPRLLVGGSGEKVTLRIASQYADWCNVGGDPECAKQRFEVLHRHCERLGRDPATIVRSNFFGAVLASTEEEAKRKREAIGDRAPGFMTLVGSTQQVIDRFAEYARAGVQHSVVQLSYEQDPDIVRLLGTEVATALRNA
jgi:F420-dependent oxidoreductase-like protein